MEWISPNQGNILSMIEGNEINPIKIEIGDSENYVVTKVSGNFPEGISLVKKNDGYYIEGYLDLVSETTKYYFTLEAKDLDTEEYIQRWFSITVETKITYWDDNNDLNLEIIEKTYFSYQYNLINPEGNETFKKIYGELPVGMTLSETGLLYGVPEEDRNYEFSYRIGVFRNDILLFKSPILKITVDDLSSLNKPLWITDSGVVDYIDFNKKKNIQLRAFDPKGRDVKYRQGEIWNLPAKSYTDYFETTGMFSIDCQTRMSLEWEFEAIPYIEDNGKIINGDPRRFKIITNAIEDGSFITWITESLEPVKIGYNYDFNIIATSAQPIIYELASGALPVGLKMNNKGNIFGTVDYQDLGTYSFTVRAYTNITFSTKTFTIDVIEGLSKDSLDVYLYINKENQESYQRMLMNYDRTSSYNPTNDLYKIPSEPKINICTIKSWDNVLLKYKFNQFNTPIDILWKETKKRSFTNYDFFYKDFNEVNKKSDYYDFKLHSDDETIETDRFGNEFRPGYIRESVDINDVEIEFWKINADGVKTEKIEDVENVHQEVKENKTDYYYIDPNLPDGDENKERLIADPIYKYKGEEISQEEFREIDDYAEFPRSYVVEYGKDVDDENNFIYVQPIAMGRYYEKESLKIVDIREPIYAYIKTIDEEDFVIRYILKDNEMVEVTVVDKEDQYCRYNPKDKDDSMYYIDITKFDSIRYTDVKNNYYKFGSDRIDYQTASIQGIREILGQEFNVSQYDGKLWYKIGSQEFVYKKNSTELQDFDFQRYTLKRKNNNIHIGTIVGNDVYNEKGKLLWHINGNKIFNIHNKQIGKIVDEKYIVDNNNEPLAFIEGDRIYHEGIPTYSADFDGETMYLYVYRQMDDGQFKQVFTKLPGSDEYVPVIQKASILDGNVDYVFYTVYRKGSKIPFTNALFECDWDENLKLTCEYDEEKGIYQWFRIKEVENPYVYLASNNSSYGFDKDIVLPNIKETGEYKFFDEELEKDLLPDYMKDSPIDDWKIGVNYNVNDKVIYRGYEYTCIIKHTSDYVFNPEKWSKGENIKEYKPTLPLFFAIPNSHNNVLKNINKYEKEYNYWYGRKFLFYEVHFSPKYEKNIDNFTIDFYNRVKNIKDGEEQIFNENSPEFLLI